jgi:hypothetical protein
MNGRRAGTIIDVVTARALQHGLGGSGAPADAAATLAELARYERAVVIRAIARVDRALLDRPSDIAERARDALEHALVLCAPRSTVDLRADAQSSGMDKLAGSICPVTIPAAKPWSV